MRLTLLIALALVSFQALAQQPGNDRVLSTGHHGTLLSTGLDDPRYLLSFPAAQRLVLTAMRERGVPVAQAQRALEGLPYRVENLEAAGVLKRDGEHYRVAYMVLSVADQRAIYAAAQVYGSSLADAFAAAAPRYRPLFARYPRAELRADLAFVTVAGYTLNWDGLRIGNELGMRAQPRTRPNGDRYLLYSKEVGPRGDVTGFYWGSHSSNPIGNIRLTTFGDAPSQPRVGGLPDIYFGVTDGIDAFKNHPALVAAATAQVNSVFDEVLRLEGAIMLALRDQPKTIRQLEELTGSSTTHVSQAIEVLLASHYVRERDAQQRYSAAVLVLSEADRAMLDEARKLGRGILTEWLTSNYDKIKRDLSELDVSKAGVDFTQTFSEVWHFVFGYATKELAQRRFYTNPRDPGRAHVGFVPVVFKADLAPMP
jgi:DNA-binding MarR family transcriptional regulator